jgi:dihydrofolate reductase
MKVILYMEMTVNGMVAKSNDETPWSDELWKAYQEMVKNVKNMIVGRKTYQLMVEADEFATIDNPFTVVLTSQNFVPQTKNTVTAHFPQEALKLVEEKGFTETIIGGGGKLNSSFMREGLVDEIYLDIEPMVFGQGIALFEANEFEYGLKLLGIKKLSDSSIQLHYAIEK